MYKTKRLLSYIKHDIPQGFKNLIRFIPLVWQLRWWDSYWLLKLIEKQLEWMEENWVKNTNYEGDETHKQNIKETLDSLKAVIKEDYGFYDKHEEKWGKLEATFTPIEGSECSKFDSNRKNILTEEDKKREKEEFVNIIYLEQELLKHDTEIVFNNLKKCKEWWD